jgi:hypothetical protein
MAMALQYGDIGVACLGDVTPNKAADRAPGDEMR